MVAGHIAARHTAAEAAGLVRGGDRTEASFDPVDSVYKNFESFADAIIGGKPFLITPDQMVHNAAIMEAVEKSVFSGVPVTVM